MSMYTPFPGYVGAKAPYSSKLQSLMPPGKTKYVEPYVGGGGLFFSMPKSKFKKVVLNDRNANLSIMMDMCLACPSVREDVIRKIKEVEKPENKDDGNALLAKLRRQMMSKGLLWKGGFQNGEIKNYRDSLKDVGAATYLAYSMGFNNRPHSFSTGSSPEIYRNKREKALANVTDCMDRPGLTILSMDGVDVIQKFKEPEKTFLYLDPPYVGIYRKNNNDMYDREMKSLTEHIRMLKAVNDTKAACIISGYRPADGSPSLYDAYLDDRWKCYELAGVWRKAEVMEVGQKRTPATEYIWVNYNLPEYAGYYIDTVCNYKQDITPDDYWSIVLGMCSNELFTYQVKHEYLKNYKEVKLQEMNKNT